MPGSAVHGESLTLTESQLASGRPIHGEGGNSIRALCPFHRSDHQRSLRLDTRTGRFHCFACGAWGYTEEARRRWREERQRDRALFGSPSSCRNRPPGTIPPQSPPRPPRAIVDRDLDLPQVDLPPLLASYQKALPGSPGEAYLKRRGIQLEIAMRLGVGYSAPGRWAHKSRDWRLGRVIFPHTDPGGRVVNLYGRAIGFDEVPKGLRHDHLPGAKGYFNAPVIEEMEGPLFICEGPFDAISLIAAGHTRTVAIFGVNGWRWDWASQVRELVFSFDADDAGASWRTLGRQAILRRKDVAFLTGQEYGGRKDINEAWAAGTLRISGLAPHDVQPAGATIIADVSR